MNSRLVVFAALAFHCARVAAQSPAPIADSVAERLPPSGVSAAPVHLSGQFAHVFTEEDGTKVLHFLGDFTLSLGEPRFGVPRQRLSAAEAVVWISRRGTAAEPYEHLQVLLWRDARISELSGTVTSGPILFATLNTSGGLEAHADDVAFSSTVTSEVYRTGSRMRRSLAELQPADEDRVVLTVIDVSGVSVAETAPRAKPVIKVRAPGAFEIHEAEDGFRVLTITGGVYLSRGSSDAEDFMELQAESVVVFLAEETSAATEDGQEPVGLGVERMPRPRGRADAPDEATSPRSAGGSDRPMMESVLGDVAVESVYLEGDVRMAVGPNQVTASRLYYDLIRDRAVILDAVVRTTAVDSKLPIYVKADEVRQLARNHFVAADAAVTTSEFHTPHYQVGAARVELLADSNGRGGAGGNITGGSFKIQHATVQLLGTPVFYWPQLTGSVDGEDTALRGLRFGYSENFGLELETDWDAFSVAGLETPDGFDATLSLDFYTDRGIGAAFDAVYERDRYYGLVRSYVMKNKGVDELGADREPGSEHDVRGRFLLRHRQFFDQDWQLTLELAYQSDRDFLEEFFESEFFDDKQRENVLYLKKQRDNWAFAAHAQVRLVDYVNATERFPDLSFFLYGRPLGPATWFSENRLGFVRYRQSDSATLRELLFEDRPGSSKMTARAHTRQEVQTPIDVGPWRVVPFVSPVLSAYSDSLDAGGVERVFVSAGVRASTYLSKVYADARSELFDIEGIRHVIKPDVTAWASATNVDGDELFPYDETVEATHDIDGISVGVRQRWQTKRGRGATRRNVDVVTWDVEVGVFNDARGPTTANGFVSFSRPELSLARNHARSSLIWRVNDRTAVLNELNWDMNDGTMDLLNVAVAIERSPRFSYLLGYRFIRETESNLLGIDFDYRMTKKHTLAVRNAFDLDRGRTLDATVAFIRRFPRWYSAVAFRLDESRDDYGVMFNIWPDGIPQASLGPRRFTGVGQTAALGPD